ncbi:MAG: hypothetical protein AB1509_06135 [Chloroflexota bacterium]
MKEENENLDAVQSHCFDPFPEPQTVPSGWDVSVFYAAPSAASSSETKPLGEAETR